MNPSPPAFIPLLEEARAGKSEALGALLDACRRYLLRIASRTIPSDLQAKRAPSDLVQESMVIAATHFDRFKGETGQDFLAWLRRILQHRFGHLYRDFRACSKRAIHREVPLAGSRPQTQRDRQVTRVPTPSEVVLQRERAEAVSKVLAAMPEPQQQILQWCYRDSFSFVEIGQRLGCSAEAARSIQRRALRKLADRLRDWRPE